MVEHNLAKVGVAGSSPVSRSIIKFIVLVMFFEFVEVAQQTNYLRKL